MCRPIRSATGCLKASRLERVWNLEQRRFYYEEDRARQERNAAAAAVNEPLEYIYRSLYLPEEGMFCLLPKDLDLGCPIEVCHLL